jgi:hypothetical protein
MATPSDHARPRAPSLNGQLPTAKKRFKGQIFARVDVGLPTNSKMLALSDRAFRLLICSWCYCRAEQNDGHLTRVAAEALARLQNAPYATFDELVEKKSWHREGTGFAVHDFLAWQLSRAEVEERRQAAQESGALGAAARMQQRDGDGEG